jgi:hypothetical protein
MTKRKWKKIALWSTGVFAGLAIVLGIHIWWVTHPHPDAGSRVMARVDLHQRISPVDADRIKNWLYQQNGVKYVLVNPASAIAVFSFAPLTNDGSQIVRDMKLQLGFDRAVRYQPPAGQASGCPAGF